MLANVTALVSKGHVAKGDNIKVIINHAGLAYLLSDTRVWFYVDEYEIIIPEKEFDGLLDGAGNG